MTLSDPLLKELKGHIIALLSGPEGNVEFHNKSYGDDNEAVFLLCHCLESIFLKGLVRYDGFTPWKADCFQWFYQVLRKYQKVIPLVFKTSFEDVLNDKKTKTHIGKTRLLIRTCLRRKCLHVPLQLHVANKDFNDTTLRVSHRPNASILGHEILSEIFLSLLLQLSSCQFSLDLTNSSFLDESWQMPSLVKVEMVPCDRLGLTLGFPLGFPVIVTILENSAAAESSDQIEIGDILDEINGICVRNLFGSKIEALFKKCRSEPFQITIIKGRGCKTSQVYLPIIKLYRILGLNPPHVEFDKLEDEYVYNSASPQTEQPSKTCSDSTEQASLLLDFGMNPGKPNNLMQSSVSNSLVQQDLLGDNAFDEFWNKEASDTNSQMNSLVDQKSQPYPQIDSFFDTSAVSENEEPNLQQEESPPRGYPKKQVPISKFYGEDGNQFLV